MASSFQNEVRSKKIKEGFKVVSVIKLSENGYPDLLCIHKQTGLVEWIECKEENDTLKPLQKVRIDELNSYGQKAYCLQKNNGQIYPIKLKTCQRYDAED